MVATQISDCRSFVTGDSRKREIGFRIVHPGVCIAVFYRISTENHNLRCEFSNNLENKPPLEL
jgi:hypothetical protein